MKNSSMLSVGIVILAMICHVSSECLPLPKEMVDYQEECREPFFVKRLFGGSKRGCIAACILTKMEFMVDGKLSIENMQKFFTDNIEDSDLAQRVNDRIKNSAMRANAGREKCETALIFGWTNEDQEKFEPLMDEVFC